MSYNFRFSFHETFLQHPCRTLMPYSVVTTDEDKTRDTWLKSSSKKESHIQSVPRIHLLLEEFILPAL